ncbi:nucleotide sugar dehydrogenase [Clostridium botulinum]|uniref:nucleotide sugar dehydrogenase n=1 Tax=Clostridium botulinum TaxID=1491 RepID=UPI0013CBE61C|nr:nucleotide sugar dehydrogenase [Clostridium botulinum]MBY7026648.1 nucleotide sugar dehydrogenase [Clostridium botulinum]NFE74256.1 nucleotide sugar dehydrogenase [Clostridium botulinum]NFL58858.1 nucleotide sugar dehydrogenase [Clostridium botulinum]NFL61685.1 nucleotide sugar dehydrogenase [Clostridium botulinum]NFO66475.1 nucleotide sugar dehydrogenase [Clostridium botulinum]
MKICVVGLGYIGLPTSAMFASHGCEVVGVDITPSVVETLNRGHIHIEEPGLEEVIKTNVKDGTFHASLEPEKSDVFIISVPTPNNNDENLSCDLTYVLKATESIIPYVKDGNVIIIESTIAPRSTEDYIKPIFEKAGFKVGKDIYLAHCPERVLPGKILFELKHNNRIVGGITSECTERAAKVYETFVEGEIIKTEAKTAELSKCMENTFRDVNIALANELTKICYKLDINVLDVINMANKHPRVNLHYPGPGVGGHCLAIDPYFIAAKAPDIAKIIRLSRDTNCSMPEFVVNKVEMLVKNINKPKIAIFGMTYKGNVDDIRESPAIEVVQKLKSKGYTIAINDPHVNNSEYVNMYDAVRGADLIVVLADHNEYKEFNHREVAQEMRRPLLFDTKAFIKQQKSSNLDIINFGSLYKYK